ncbi:PREDICTED: muscle M-line assembly protein unc-89-like [Dufourea novaeangliae]|uniref:Uncharacterized protein n=1 Tax=Dufourea novaeangliae TaxID=178035 RepID=A0A154PNY7_DUFNO|nr:PREDICTED: muscle M-line assembly protein unc-89-like [Dufourea novaeangliae]KZC13572.1 hypothetical protein WN55_05124 [Dufourea novaeangliae]
MVPCAQGRVIVETARPAPPYFATCTRYRRTVTTTSNEIAACIPIATSSSVSQVDYQLTSTGGKILRPIPPHTLAVRPEDLGVTPWYLEDYPTIDCSRGPAGDRGSYPSYLYADTETKPDMVSTRNSSMDSELPRPSTITAAPRKAYMDLQDAIALLDETCPNPEVSPSLTPRTPRTPLTPHPRNKRARSKSSDNSSNYSNDRLSDRSFESRPPEKDKKRPFLKKIGISLTEDKPFLAMIAPKIIGKPYLEKIGPSRAVERPFLDKIGSSKTLDKFTFETPRRQKRPVVRSETLRDDVKKAPIAKKLEEQKLPEEKPQKSIAVVQAFGVERRRSGKGPLMKMYSFETEDLESTVQIKDSRDPLRGASLDDVLDSGPSSLPLESTNEGTPKTETKERAVNGAALLKCRVTTSEEIIFSSTSYGSDKEPNSWGNSPKIKWQVKIDGTTPRTPTRRKIVDASKDGDSVPNSPTKRPISNVSADHPDDSRPSSFEKNVYSPMKTRRQTYEDLLERNGRSEERDKKPSKQAHFERRGISSDNLLSKDRTGSSCPSRGQIEITREATSEDSLAHRIGQEYNKETFKQLQDKFKYHEVPTETYADFKRRTRGSVQSIIVRQQERWKVDTATETREDGSRDAKTKSDETKSEVSASPTRNEKESNEEGRNESVRGTIRSVLKKQQGIDHPSDHEDNNASAVRPKRRIIHEPSQETMDLLTELRKVKSQLKTPSWEKELELDKKPTRQPRRILLTDKEFCLSVERENSIRRPSRVMNSLERTDEAVDDKDEDQKIVEEKKNGDVSQTKIPGPALFEKKCLSLDYADEEKPQRPEPRAISLSSTRNVPSGADEMTDYADLAFNCDSKSCSSDVFNSPTEETSQHERGNDPEKGVPKIVDRNHCAEVDIAIPIDQKLSSPKGRVQIQGRTSDLYEIISPRSTPFRVKKRLGKISVEDTVKPESFTLGSKVDCRSAVVQKRTKCFPL